MYCVPGGHHLVCNPQGARDFTTAELHALACLIAAAAVLGLTAFAMHRIARAEERAPALPPYDG